MPSQTKYPQTITQVTADSTYTGWTNTNNLKDGTSNYASTSLLTSVKGKHPKIKKLQLTNFGFTLPEGAEVTSIVVNMSYRKRAKTGTKYPSVGAPNILLKNTALVEPYRSTSGPIGASSFPTSSWKRTWDGRYTEEVIVPGTTTVTNGVITTKEAKTITITREYDLPSRATVNNSSFGVEFQFPKNTSENEGYIDFRICSITVNYIIPSYGLSLIRLSDEEIVKDNPVMLRMTLHNKDLANYRPTLQLSTPSDMELSLKTITIGGSFTKIEDGLYEWKPEINKQIGTLPVDIEVTPHTSGNNTLRLVELLTATAASITLDVQAQSTNIPDEEIPVEQALYAVQGEAFTIPVKVPVGLLETVTEVYLHTDTDITIEGTTVLAGSYYTIPVSAFNENGEVYLSATTSATGTINLAVDFTTTAPDTPTFILKVAPEGIGIPKMAIYPVNVEESGRFGHGYNYEISSFLEIVCDPQAVSYFEDFYRNFRLGVVNSTHSTNREDIFKACRNWSTGLTALNEFERKSIEFTYNEDYPLYIIVTGNFETEFGALFTVNFTDFEVMEDDRTDTPNQVVFPEPIRDVLTPDDSYSAILSIPRYLTSNSLIFYDFTLPDAFENRQNLAIRGIGVKVNAKVEEPVMLSAKLTGNGQTGERTSIITSLNDTWTLGGTADRWGFTITDLKNINTYNIEIAFSNISTETNDEVEVDIEDIELIIYYNFYENSLVECFVDGENLSSYNIFLEDVEIPAGLETDTKYLTVEGTDTNDGYRQNIREKEITIEFSISECTFDEATRTLEDITELLVNERDSLNNPIEKRIEFSHYPNLYWEYIMEKAIDVSNDAGNYTCKVKLTVPSGTAYTTEEISTGKAGTVQGLAKINPVIRLTPLDEHIEIEETESGQKFMMGYNTWTSSDIVEIDCNERTVTLEQDEEEIDITAYTDYNSNWFQLHRNFLFEETNCLIQSVTWTERR